MMGTTQTTPPQLEERRWSALTTLMGDEEAFCFSQYEDDERSRRLALETTTESESKGGRKHIHDARRPSARVEVDRWMRADPTDNDDDNRPTIETPPTAVFDVTMMMRW
jgi:hypothetical protein